MSEKYGFGEHDHNMPPTEPLSRDDAMCKQIEDDEKTIKDLTEEMKSLRKDRKRLDWLDNVANYAKVTLLIFEMNKSDNFRGWRESIDRAMDL